MKEKIGFEKLTLKEALILPIGMLVVSAAIYYLMMPSGLVIGTMSGLVLVISNFVPLSVSTLTFILNMILLVLGYLCIGKDFGGKTVITSLLLPAYLWIFERVTPEVRPLTDDLLVNALCFILMISIGQAMLFNINASSGGLDIVAKIMNKYLHTDIGQSLSISGLLIACTSIFVYDTDILIVSLLCTYFGGVVLDHFIDGSRIRKRVSIISPNYKVIQDFVVQKLNRGVTLYEAKGGWDNSEKIIMVTILQKNEYAQLLSYINHVDPAAFVTVETVGEVIGKWNPHTHNPKWD